MIFLNLLIKGPEISEIVKLEFIFLEYIQQTIYILKLD